MREAIEKVLRRIMYGKYEGTPIQHTILLKRILQFVRDIMGGVYDDVGEE